MIEKVLRFGLLAALALPMAACATAPDGPADFAEGPPPPPAYGPPGYAPPELAPTPAAYDEILPELPTDAPPGVCYAKVVVPGQPIAQPPPIQSAQWMMRPGPAGPIWCLVPVTFAPPPAPALAVISRQGWIRVLCDTDATPERIGRIQHSLHDRGYYHGGYSGRYDHETVEAVTRFQSNAHIAHGGYLSLETVQALDAPYGGPPVYAGAGAYAGAQTYAAAGAYASASAGGYATGSGYPPAYAQPPVMPYGFQSGYRSGYAAGPAYSYGPPVGYPPRAYGPPAQAYPGQYPCCGPAGGYQSGYGASYGYNSYGYSNSGFGGVNSPAVQNGWLVWSGKTTF